MESRSGRTLWEKALALALFGVTVTTLGARPAGASGCHAVERPTLGLSSSWEDDLPTQARLDRVARPAARVSPLPCSGALPGRSGRGVPSQPGAPAPPDRFERGGARDRFLPEHPRPRARILTERLERPPRDPLDLTCR